MTQRATNWSGNVTFRAEHCHRPTSLEQLQEIVARSRQARTLGTAHSFTDVADTLGDLIRLDGLPERVEVDPTTETVTVGAGIRYAELCPRLHAYGRALSNLASLPHVSVAGACATATHGSGVTNGNLATAVRALDMVTADGELVTVSRDTDGELFDGFVVGLGALGVVVAVTLDTVPAFDVRQYVYDALPAEQLEEHVTEIFSSAYSVCVFTDWENVRHTSVWWKQRVDGPQPPEPERTWFGAALADGPRHPAPRQPVVACTPQGGSTGPWYERLPHFRADATPSTGDELQSEYFVPFHHAASALRAVRDIRERIASALQISELRTVAADRLWLSPCYGRDVLGIHFTWRNDPSAVLPLLPLIERQLEPFDAAPHWGKLFTMPPETVRSRYPRWSDFEKLRGRGVIRKPPL